MTGRFIHPTKVVTLQHLLKNTGMNELYAKALTKIKYKEADGYRSIKGFHFLKSGDIWVEGGCRVDPMEDTLEGRRQADALEDWLFTEHRDIWYDSQYQPDDGVPGRLHQWRLDRIKWCFEQDEIQEALK